MPDRTIDETEKRGHEVIAEAVASLSPPVVIVEMHRQLGDVLHSTIVMRHIRAAHPTAKLVWAISEAYGQTFEHFTPAELGPHAFALLPKLPDWPADGQYRIRWVRQAQSLPGVIRSFGCGVHPWGWKRGSIVDAILENSGITSLAVPRRPWLPITPEDVAFADRFLAERGLSRYVAMEYSSYSLQLPPPEWYAEFVSRVQVPVVAIAGQAFPTVPGSIDGRATTFRQAKALIARSSCFLGGCSGLSVIAAAHGCEQPVVEISSPDLSMVAIGYRRRNDRHRMCHQATPAVAATAVRSLMV